jgi:transposase
LRQGLELPEVTDLFGQRGRRWLEALTLPGWAGESLDGFLGLFDRFTAELERIERAVEAHAASDAIVAALQTLPGIGGVLGVTIRAEIGVIERFSDAPHLASYAGLVPRVDSSGRRVRYGRVTKRGSTWPRWALTKAGTHGLRRDDEVGRWARRLAVQKGILKARPAIARALCADILRVWLRSA